MQLPLEIDSKIENLAKFIDRLDNDYKKASLRNCYLVCGPSFIGKSEACLKFARSIVEKQFWSLDIFTCDVQFEKIGISNLRQLQDNLSKTSHGKTRFCIIRCVDKLSVPAANSLLKTLEDTPKDVVFLLTCSNEQNLLETIKSRSIVVRVSDNQVVENITGVKFYNKIALKYLYDQDEEFRLEYDEFFKLWEEFCNNKSDKIFKDFLINIPRKKLDLYLEILCLELSELLKDKDVANVSSAISQCLFVRDAISKNSNIKLGMEVLNLKLGQVFV